MGRNARVKVPKRYGIRYPWKQWLAKKRIVLVKGRDYHISMFSMRQMVLNKASKLRLSVETEVYEVCGVLVVNVLGTLPAKKRHKRGH